MYLALYMSGIVLVYLTISQNGGVSPSLPFPAGPGKVNGNISGFCGVVVITSALHAEGREFEPRQNLFVFYLVSNHISPPLISGIHTCMLKHLILSGSNFYCRSYVVLNPM